MYSRIQWFGKFWPCALMLAIGVSPLAAQMKEIPSVRFGFVEPEADAARDLFNSAKDLIRQRQVFRCRKEICRSGPEISAKCDSGS